MHHLLKFQISYQVNLMKLNMTLFKWIDNFNLYIESTNKKKYNLKEF